MMRCLIGIPTLNGPDRLQRCLQAIVECTSVQETSIMVADDGSEPDALEQNKNVISRFGVEMLTTGGARLGVAATWNRLARHVRSTIIVLVNDDVEVVPDWLDVLLYSVEHNPQAGVVSLRCLTGVTKADVPVSRGQVDYHEAALLSGGGTLVTTGGAVFAVRREVYDRIGGFDERYFCFYEEVDFCVAAHKLGYRNYIASYPLVYHMGGATTSNGKNLDAAKAMSESRRKFADKWGATPDALRSEFAREDSASHLLLWNTQIRSLRDD